LLDNKDITQHLAIQNGTAQQQLLGFLFPPKPHTPLNMLLLLVAVVAVLVLIQLVLLVAVVLGAIEVLLLEKVLVVAHRLNPHL
jgi:hypothetical protein